MPTKVVGAPLNNMHDPFAAPFFQDRLIKLKKTSDGQERAVQVPSDDQRPRHVSRAVWAAPQRTAVTGVPMSPTYAATAQGSEAEQLLRPSSLTEPNLSFRLFYLSMPSSAGT